MASADDGLSELLRDELAPLGAIAIRRMFGGAGVFLDGLMFAIIADETLFLKADADTRGAFEAEGLGPLSYKKSTGQSIALSYWQAPERLLDETDELRAWARAAIAVSLRSASAKRGPGKRGPGKRGPAGQGRLAMSPSRRKSLKPDRDR